MRIGGGEAGGPALRGSGRKRREPGVDAATGRTVHTGPVLREPENGGVARDAGFRGEPEASVAADGIDGDRGRLFEAEAEPAGRRSQDLSVPAERSGSGSRQSGVEHRHHVHKDGAGLRLSGGGDGLVQPIRFELEGVTDPGTRLLHRGVEGRRCGGGGRKYSTVIRVRSSPARSSPVSWRPGRSSSAWMGGDAAWPTFSFSGCGVWKMPR